MSKLKKVREALKNNTTIAIHGILDDNYLPFGDDRWGHSVYFFIAPKVEEYQISRLQELMISLIPDLKPTHQDDFREDESHIYFGYLQFEEDIGQKFVQTKVILSDEDMFSAPGFVNGARIIKQTEKIKRIMRVRLFPSAKIAAEALEGNDEYRIKKVKLPACCL